MSNKYRYDHRLRKNRKRHIFIVLVISLLVTAILAITILLLLNQTTKKIKIVSGPTEQVGVVTSNPASTTKTIQEQNYSFSLPTEWKQIKQDSGLSQNSITWQSFQPNATNRYITIYSEPIPATFPVNRELPLEAHGTSLSFGSLSDNCANFTSTNQNKSLVPVLAKWQEVDFYCNSPNFADNQIGTGTIGSVNSVTLVGPISGMKHYFFLYVDRNTSPDYSIFYSILNSFQAK
jgi:hypothetical protein